MLVLNRQARHSMTAATGFIALLLMLVVTGASASLNAEHAVNPALSAHYFVDEDASLTIEQILHMDEAQWQINDQPTPSFGYSKAAFWFRIPVTHLLPDLQHFLLSIEYPILDNIQFYAIHNDQIEAQYQSGDLFPFAQRPLHDTHYLFPFDLQPAERKNLYLRVQTESAVQIPMHIWPREHYFMDRQNDLLGQGIYFGIMAVMAIYNLFIFLTIRYSAYLFYVGSVVGMTLFVATIRGYGFQFFWPDLPAVNAWALSMTLCLFGSCALVFSISILRLRLNSRFFYFALLTCLAIYLPMFVLSFLLPYRTAIGILIPLGIVASLMGLCAGIRVWVKGYRPARYYVLAYTSLIIGSLIISMSKLGYIPRNLFTEHAIQLGSVLDVVLLSFALADRINTEKRERIEAEKKVAAMELKMVHERFAQKEKQIAAAAAVQARDEFISTMSHEIRTPMNGVIGVLQLMEDTQIDEQQHEYLRIMNGSAQTMLHILNDILDFSKIESGKMVIEQIPFHLHQLLDDIAHLYKTRVRLKSNLHFKLVREPDIPETVLGDPVRLRQIITNYLNNAFKFTREGQIELHVTRLNGEIVFRVIDEGIGISKEAQSRLFQKFSQTDSDTSRKYGGTGLGLSICKDLSELMGGSVGVLSEVGKGSSFWCRIPLPETTLAPVAQNQATHDLSGLQVLVADDNPVNRFITKKMLQKLGIEAITADNGREVLEKYPRQPLDVIFLDGHMPELDGYETARRIRAMEASQSAPPIFLVALTASASEKDRQYSLQCGMNAHLTKPLILNDLIHTLHQAQKPTPLKS